MISSGFTNAPVSQFIVFSVVIGAVVATLTDTRYYLPIAVVPHIWGYGQLWRFVTWNWVFTNSTEVLFGVLAFYQLRVIERLWGSRKFLVCASEHSHCTMKRKRPTANKHTTELPYRNTPLHNPPTPPPPNVRPAPAHIRLHQPPPLRPNQHPLRPPRKLLRRNPIHIPLPHLARLAVTINIDRPAGNQHLGPQHHSHKQSDFLPCARTARALAVPGVAAGCSRRLGGGHGVSPGFTAGCVCVEGTGVDGGAGGGEGRV